MKQMIEYISSMFSLVLYKESADEEEEEEETNFVTFSSGVPELVYGDMKKLRFVLTIFIFLGYKKSIDYNVEVSVNNISNPGSGFTKLGHNEKLISIDIEFESAEKETTMENEFI